MAQRRMISLRIIDTDQFLEMPVSSRLLYYDMILRADDDGFVSNPKKIIRINNCSEDDFKILLAKNYIIVFKNSGVCVITHWKVHNFIRSDRYSETMFKNEKKLLKLVCNKYELKQDVTKNVIPNVIPRG